jgi:nucleotide-binding universal stress UspA family protein
VPRDPSTPADDALSTFRRILIPTDFSEIANRAVRVGYGLVEAGGIVYLLHVVTGKPGENDASVIERLRGLIPRGAAAKGVSTEVEVMEDREAWSGIWHVSGRLGVDAICMATHGRSGVYRVMLGSQAQEVLQHVRQPVVLVPPEREG